MCLSAAVKPDLAERLTSVECGRKKAIDERGWRAYLTVDEDEPAEAIVYWPDCAEREFGAPPGRPPKM
jgi:hypothetical protein